MTRRRGEAGFTFIEILITLVFMSIALLAATSQFPMGLRVSESAENITLGTNLAQELLEEIRAYSWEDPNEPPYPPLGPDGLGETDRFSFDDIDDFDGLMETPPVDLDGNPMDGAGGRPNFSKYSRDVTVVYIDETTGDVSAVPTPYKRIEVGVSNIYTGLRTSLRLFLARQP